MMDLLAAAKAVIKAWDSPSEPHIMSVDNLRAAVDLAENQAEMTMAVKDYTYVISGAYAGGYNAGQQAERERIRDIIRDVTGGFGDCDRLMEKIDE